MVTKIDIFQFYFPRQLWKFYWGVIEEARKITEFVIYLELQSGNEITFTQRKSIINSQQSYLLVDQFFRLNLVTIK